MDRRLPLGRQGHRPLLEDRQRAGRRARWRAAYEADPRNIQAVIDKANALYHAPAIFGGDKREAIKLFLKSVSLMETSKTTDQNWVYLHVLTLIARAYEKQNKSQEAKLIYEKILRKEPNFKLVKEVLYPRILTKLKN